MRGCPPSSFNTTSTRVVDTFYQSDISLSYDFKLSAGHRLVNQGGKCVNFHGHNYKIRLTLEGKPNPNNNMLIDTYQLKQIFDKLIDKVHDHKNLNETMGTDNPTMEFMAYYIFWQLKVDLPMLKEVKVWETDYASATYRV